MSQMIDTCRPHFVVLWLSPTSHAALVWAPSSDVSVYGLCVASVAILMKLAQTKLLRLSQLLALYSLSNTPD